MRFSSWALPWLNPLPRDRPHSPLKPLARHLEALCLPEDPLPNHLEVPEALPRPLEPLVNVVLPPPDLLPSQLEEALPSPLEPLDLPSRLEAHSLLVDPPLSHLEALEALHQPLEPLEFVVPPLLDHLLLLLDPLDLLGKLE